MSVFDQLFAFYCSLITSAQMNWHGCKSLWQFHICMSDVTDFWHPARSLCVSISLLCKIHAYEKFSPGANTTSFYEILQ